MPSSFVLPAKWAIAFAVQAGFSVIAGAFGAHALNGIMDGQALGWWHTASQYLMYHALAGLIVICLCHYLSAHRAILVFFLIGNVLFAGSLYVMALTGQTWLGAITPLGGMCYLLAWLFLIARLWQVNVKNRARNQ